MQRATPFSQEAMQVISLALLEVMKQGHVYLATYAVAVLVNISHESDTTKNFLMSGGVAPLCVNLLKTASKGYRCDDDLVLYTCTLLVNLTKSVLHRTFLIANGCVPVVAEVRDFQKFKWKKFK